MLGVVGECSFDFEKANLVFQRMAIMFQEANPFDDQPEEAKGEAQGQFIFEQSLLNTFYKQNEKNDFEGFQAILNFYMTKNFLGNWKLDRYRLDKSDPNGTRTAQNVILTIFENLDMKQLTRMIWEINAKRKKMQSQGAELSMMKKIKF